MDLQSTYEEQSGRSEFSEALLKHSGSLREADYERIRSVISDPDRSPDGIVRRLLELGAERLDVKDGVLAHVNAVLGTRTIVETSGGPSPVVPKGHTTDLEATYCRRTTSANVSSFAVRDAPNEGWSDDPAYETSGIRCYLGAPVPVGDQPYGTVCFVDTDAHSTAFEEADEAFVEATGQLIGRLFHRASDEPSTAVPGGSPPSSSEPEDADGQGMDDRPDEWLRSIVDNIEEGLYRTTPDAGLVYVNQPLVELFGYESADEMRSLPPEQLYARPSRRAELFQIADGEGQGSREVQFKRKDGSTFTGRLSGSVTRDEQGNVKYIDGVVANISEKKGRERHLQQTTAQLEALFDHSPDMICLHDGEGNILKSNPRLCDKTGYTEEEITDMKVWDLDRETTDPDTLKARWVAMELGDRLRSEGRYERRDGSTFPIEAHVQRLDLEGKERFVVISRDVTERKRHEREVRDTTEKLRGILDANPNAVVALDRDGHVQFWNPAAERIFGWSKEEVLESPLPIIPEEKMSQHKRLRTRVLGGESLEGVVVKRQRKDGTVIDVRISAAPLRDEDDNVTGIMAVLQDVTEQKKRERRLEAVFNQTYQFTGLMRPDGTMLEINDTALAFAGLTEEDVTGKPLWESHWMQTGKESKRKLRDAIERAASGEFVRYEREVRGADENRIIDFSIRPVTNLEGEVTLLIPEGRDITEKKERERDLEETRNRMRLALNHTDSVIFEIDPSTQSVSRHGPFERFFGVDPDDASTVATFAEQAVHPADREELRRFYRELAQGERTDGTLVYRTNPSAGPVRWMRDDIYVEGETGRIIGLAQDVTERKEREQSLRERETQLRGLAHSIPGVAFQFYARPDGEYGNYFVSEHAEDVLGISADPETFYERALGRVPASHRQALQESIDEAVEDASPWRFEMPFEKPSGERIWLLGASTPEVRDEEIVFNGVLLDITERKEQEQALQEERDLLDRVFRTSPTAVTVLDADGNFVRISDRAREILGLEKDDVTDRTFNDPEWHITAPDGSPFPEEELPFYRVRETGESVFGVEHAIEWPDGTRRLLSISGAPLHDDDSTFQGAVFHLDDITERRRAKRNLQKSEQRFRGVFENAALGIALVNEAGELLEANSALASMLGRDQASLRGLHFEELTHPEDREADRHLYRELIAGKRDQYQLEKRYLRKSGEAFWGRLMVSRQGKADDTQIVGMVEDIDAEKKRKRDLRLFQQMVEQAEDAIVLSKSELPGGSRPEIIYANPAFTEMTGYSYEDVVGQTADILHGPDTQSQVIERMEDRLQQGKPAEGETINYRRDGTPFVNRWNVAPVRDATNEITHLVSVQRDVTEQRRMQERLLEVQEEERRRIDQEIHDEMGGLFTSLQMTVELARMEAREDSVSPDHLDDIEELVSELSSTARTISRKLYPSRALSESGLIEAVRTIIDGLGPDPGLNVDLHAEIDSDEHISSLVERTACWIVQEALVNVARHAETDAAQVVLTRTDRQLRLQVIDEGVGFDPDQQSNSGFGLEGIQRRVERLNGTLDLDTAPGEGTHLTVALPLTILSLPHS